MNKLVGLTLLLALALSGCATTRGSTAAAWPWKDSPCRGDTCTAAEARAAYNAATNYCIGVNKEFEYGGYQSNKTRVVLGAVGALAGSVISPLAKGSSAKAWAGLSGATNAVQTSVGETFSASLAIKRQAAVTTAADKDTAAFIAEADADSRVLLAMDMARTCRMAPSTADASALKAMMLQ